MNYYQVKFELSVRNPEISVDMLKVELLPLGFDSFVDINKREFEAYCPQREFNSTELDKILHTLDFIDFNQLKYSVVFIEDKNWNADWEKTSPSVLFGTFCHIRKLEHQKKDVKYDIIINPKQSFGTANHPTTALIINFLSKQNLTGKKVMDMGCGTGVLGILAKKMGAGYVECIDIDDWAYKNAIDNAKQNNIDITIKLGSTDEISEDILFDVFFANINLNIILDNIEKYCRYISKDGILILSGFFEDDVQYIESKIKPLPLTFYHKDKKDNWALVVLKRT